MVSTPLITGAPSSSADHASSSARDLAASRSTSVAAARSSVARMGMSSTTRDQSLDRLVTWRSALLGTTTNSPADRAQLGDPQRQLLDGSRHPGGLPGLGQPDEVTDAELTLGEQEEPGQQVAHHLLGTEPEGHTRHRGRGHQRGQGHAELADGQDGSHEVGERHERPLHRLGDGPRALGGLRHRPARLDGRQGLLVEGVAVARHGPLHEPGHQHGSEHEHDGGQ